MLAHSIDLALTEAGSIAKTVVLDTSVLVAEPGALSEFEGCALKIPLTVIEELDSLKTRADGVGRTARDALRRIEGLRVAAGGSLVEPVVLGHGGTLAIVILALLFDAVFILISRLTTSRGIR